MRLAVKRAFTPGSQPTLRYPTDRCAKLPAMSKRLKRILSGVVAVVVLAPGATFVYFHFISSDAPPPLTLSSSDTTATSAPSSSSPSTSAVVTGDVSGAWKPTTGSQVGYRVNEVAFGQSKAAVGRTSDV